MLRYLHNNRCWPACLASRWGSGARNAGQLPSDKPVQSIMGVAHHQYCVRNMHCWSKIRSVRYSWCFVHICFFMKCTMFLKGQVHTVVSSALFKALSWKAVHQQQPLDPSDLSSALHSTMVTKWAWQTKGICYQLIGFWTNSRHSSTCDAAMRKSLLLSMPSQAMNKDSRSAHIHQQKAPGSCLACWAAASVLLLNSIAIKQMTGLTSKALLWGWHGDAAQDGRRLSDCLFQEGGLCRSSDCIWRQVHQWLTWTHLHSAPLLLLLMTCHCHALCMSKLWTHLHCMQLLA